MINILFFLLILFSFGAYSDASPYRGEKSIFYKVDNLLVLHEHYRKGRGDNIKIISYIELIDLNEKQQNIFKQDSGIFSRLWLSPNKKMIIGFSEVKSFNNQQIVVYSTQGEMLASSTVSCDVWASKESCFETMGAVYWFDSKINISPEVTETKNDIKVCVEANKCLTIKKNIKDTHL